VRLLTLLPLCTLSLAPLAAAEDTQGREIVERYIEATQAQKQALRGVQMEVDLEARLPRLEKNGKLRALRRISKLGLITYKALGFSGDSMVKKEVIARYLAEDSAADKDGHDIAITPANYKFKYKGRVNRDGRLVDVFQLSPRRKAVGLFHGELWLDAETAMPVRESGRFVKSPSLFLKKIEFVREYDIRNGVAIPRHIESKADVRVFGRAELTVDYSNFSRQEIAEESEPDPSNR
jgi:hypothetical protein